jgi:hypothetical protein
MAFAMHRSAGMIMLAFGWLLVGAIAGCLQVTIAIPTPSPEAVFRVPPDSLSLPSPQPAPVPSGAGSFATSPSPLAQEAGVTAQGQFLANNPVPIQNGFTAATGVGYAANPIAGNWGPYTTPGSAYLAPPGVAPLTWQPPVWPLAQSWPLNQAWPLNGFGTPYAYAMAGPQVFMIPVPEPEITVVVPTPVPSPVIIIVIQTPTPTTSPAN